MSMLRDISRGGSAIVLDPKGELFEQTAGSFRQVYRLDLLNPSRSDRWKFVPQCKDDHEFASQMAATMIGLEGTKHSFADPFWQESELLLLTTVLLHLSDVVDIFLRVFLALFIDCPLVSLFDSCNYRGVPGSFFHSVPSVPNRGPRKNVSLCIFKSCSHQGIPPFYRSLPFRNSRSTPRAVPSRTQIGHNGLSVRPLSLRKN